MGLWLRLSSHRVRAGYAGPAVAAISAGFAVSAFSRCLLRVLRAFGAFECFVFSWLRLRELCELNGLCVQILVFFVSFVGFRVFVVAFRDFNPRLPRRRGDEDVALPAEDDQKRAIL